MLQSYLLFVPFSILNSLFSCLEYVCFASDLFSGASFLNVYAYVDIVPSVDNLFLFEMNRIE